MEERLCYLLNFTAVSICFQSAIRDDFLKIVPSYPALPYVLGGINEVVVSCKHPESVVDVGLRLRPIRKTYPVLGQVRRREVHLDQTQVHLGGQGSKIKGYELKQHT